MQFNCYFLYSASNICLYFSQSPTCVTFTEKNYKLKTNKNVLGPTGPISCKNVIGNCFSYKLRSELQLLIA